MTQPPRKLLRRLLLGCALLIAAALYVPWDGLYRLWSTDQTALAREGLPIVQAIYDFRAQHGHWPSSLDDLVPQYLPARPAGVWSYSHGTLLRYIGLPHTFIGYDFSQPEDGWQSRGDFGKGRLDVPPPLSTRPADLPIFDRDQQ